jgi:hypothetical protein
VLVDLATFIIRSFSYKLGSSQLPILQRMSRKIRCLTLLLFINVQGRGYVNGEYSIIPKKSQGDNS